MTEKSATLKSYIHIARPEHWFKNIFLVPGTIIAWQLTDTPAANAFTRFLIGFASACLISSANYVINEWVDRSFDKHHPYKKLRPAITGNMRVELVTLEYVSLTLGGLLLAHLISAPFFWSAVLFLVMGVLYNIRPFRTKDRPFIDILSESFNNPIRLLLGWLVVMSKTPPPSSLLIAYWMGGAYLMAIKRYSEYKYINDPEKAAAYRQSFAYYNEKKLLISSLFYALCASSLGGVFLVRYKLELIITLPLYAWMFAWYFYIGLKPNSAAQHPERMYRERAFIVYVLVVFVLTLLLIHTSIPALEGFFIHVPRYH